MKIKTPRINWMKMAESMAAMNPYGPMILADGSIYSPDGRLLAPPAASPPTARPAPAPGFVAPLPAAPVAFPLGA